MSAKVETTADRDVRECLENHQSFALIAGAGSGKTTSLVDALERIRESEGVRLRQNGQRVACITYTKRAVEVINKRLGFDDLYLVTTLHSFLWSQVGRFQEDIRRAIKLDRLPRLIEKERERDNGGTSKAAKEARDKAARYQQALEAIDGIHHFAYRDSKYSDYLNGQLGHDDVIEVASYLFQENATFRRITGLRFPYILVDEAQDTFAGIVNGLNLVCERDGLPVVGYFGDPWQQIYDVSVGDFSPPASGKVIKKTENFRCSKSVIALLNAFRGDVEQYAAGDNKGRVGSVIFRLVQAEKPELPRNRYSEEQITRTLERMDQALRDWGWAERQDFVRLFLSRQMIARRMGFAELNKLFTGTFASSRAQDAFEQGEHFLVKPLTATVLPLVEAHEAGDSRKIIDILRRDSPAFSVDGPNATKTLKSMIDTSIALVDQLAALYKDRSTGDILRFCAEKRLIQVSESLQAQLARQPRTETYDEQVHGIEKGDWLADEFFAMATKELSSYASFIDNNTAYSTQHGVKGEEYTNVLVVYDDVEASWNNYSFGKVLTPATMGQATDQQQSRTQKLAYVSFSRALDDLRVLLFTAKPQEAQAELIARKLLQANQIEIVA